jgi:hypothetical protein
VLVKGEVRMSKKEGHKKVVADLLNEFLKTGNEEKVMEYLISNSNLPGPRGNLELADAFAEVVEDSSIRNPQKIWELASRLTDISPNEAPVNNPKEFLPFCGVVAIGAIGSVHARFYRKAFTVLKKLANDSRWRTREAVAMGIQKLVAKQSQNTLKGLESWIEKNEWLAMRAVAAGVAEPALLRDEQTARGALELHKRIFAHILAARERKSNEFKTLRQALGYSLSVVICAIPKEGFEYMQQIIDSQDVDVLWVMRENLKKNRLIKNFPNEVAAIKKLPIMKEVFG